MSQRRLLTLVAMLGLLAGCDAVGLPGAVPVDGGGQAVLDCQPPFAFEGQTTLAELAIPEVGVGGQEATRVGHVAITRDPVRHEDFAPPGAPGPNVAGQVLCIEWPDGSGMSMMLTEPWQPAGLDALAADDGAPWAALAVVIAVVVVLAVSVVAFRSRPDPTEPG